MARRDCGTSCRRLALAAADSVHVLAGWWDGGPCFLAAHCLEATSSSMLHAPLPRAAASVAAESARVGRRAVPEQVRAGGGLQCALSSSLVVI